MPSEMKITLVGVTKRDLSIEIYRESIERQTRKPDEVIIVDEQRRKSGYIDLEPTPKLPNMFYNLSACMNKAIKHSTGDYILLLQDLIYVPEYGVEKYVEAWEKEGDALYTGVGHTYKCNPKTGLKPHGEIKYKDPRMGNQGFYVTQPVCWEANYAFFPKKAWVDIGGFDEEFDAGWGYDNVNFAERCQLAGYNIFIDTSNEIFAFGHDTCAVENGSQDRNNQDLWSIKIRAMQKGIIPWKLNYA